MTKKRYGWIICPDCTRRMFWFVLKPRRCRYCGERMPLLEKNR